jgi:hypothetical protein
VKSRFRDSLKLVRDFPNHEPFSLNPFCGGQDGFGEASAVQKRRRRGVSALLPWGLGVESASTGVVMRAHEEV